MKYILLLLCASLIFFAGCSDSGTPGKYNTPETPQRVASPAYYLQKNSYQINQYRKIIRGNGDTMTVYIKDSITLDTVWVRHTAEHPVSQVTSFQLNHLYPNYKGLVPWEPETVIHFAADQYPLNKWRAEHERKFNLLNEVSRIATNDSWEYDGIERHYDKPGYDLSGASQPFECGNAPVGYWEENNTGFEALKDVELYSFWK